MLGRGLMFITYIRLVGAVAIITIIIQHTLMSVMFIHKMLRPIMRLKNEINIYCVRAAGS